MSEQFVIHLVREAIFTALLVASPMLIAGLVTGVLVSLVQAVTQLQEMTLTFIPKVVAVVAAMILSFAWIMHTLLDFTTTLFRMLPTLSL
jgi:flagellar biosynthetic protein FliQ